MPFLDRIKAGLGKVKTAVKNVPVKLGIKKPEPPPIPPKPVAPAKPLVPAKYADSMGRLKAQLTGEKLKTKMINFGLKYKINSSLVNKIIKMNPNYLEDMYKKGRILFDAYFDYDDLDKGPYGSFAGDLKNNEAQELIDEYEKRYGPL